MAKLIADGLIRQNGSVLTSPNARAQEGDTLEILFVPPVETELAPEARQRAADRRVRSRVHRPQIARDRDRAVFRVVGDTPLIEAVGSHPRRVEELAAIKGFPGGLARAEGKELLRRLHAVREMDESELVPYPKHVRRGPGRPPPELEATVDRLKAGSAEPSSA